MRLLFNFRQHIAHTHRCRRWCDLVIVAANNSNVARLCFFFFYLVLAWGYVRLIRNCFLWRNRTGFLKKNATQICFVCRKIKSIFKPCKFALYTRVRVCVCVSGCGAVSLLSAACEWVFLCLSRIRHVVCRNAGRHLTKEQQKKNEKKALSICISLREIA